MIFQHLNDPNTYPETNEKCDNRVTKKIGELTNKYESVLTKAEKLYPTNIFFQQVISMDYPRFINLNK